MLSSRCYRLDVVVLLLRSKPAQQNWMRFLKNFIKTVRALRVNGTKVTLRNAFIDNLFPLESEKKSQKGERTPF